MNDNNRKLQLCEIDYTNVWPVTHYFPIMHYQNEIELIRSVPAILNGRMLEGSIDVGPISSFAYGVSHRHYLLMPKLSVSAYGPVRSILLFYRGDLEQVKHGSIALTKTSATSVNLLKIIMQKFYGGSPVYQVEEPVLLDMMARHDAALLIGDDAIRESWQDNGYNTLDLGAEWTRLTGHSMTYAVWAIRRDAAERYPELLARIVRDYVESKRKAKLDPNDVIQAAIARMGGTTNYWQMYFGGLTHDLDSEQCAGLQLYYEYALELGLLQEPVEHQFFHLKGYG